MALTPLLLFIPAVMLAGMGPCGYARPWVMVAALAVFVVFEMAAVPCFIRDARRAGKSIPAIFGISVALFMLVLSATFEFLTITDYL